MALTTVRSTGIGSLPAISGANLTSLNASNIASGTLNSARFSGGKILQVVQKHYSNEQSTTGQSFVTTNLTQAITPSATSSKVLVLISARVNAYKNSGNSSVAHFSIYRDSTNVFNTGAVQTHNISATGGADGLGMRTMMPFNYLDSPSTTSSITYDFRMLAQSGSTAYAHQNSHPSIMLLLEVGA